jgi:hypothetical protein
MNITTNESILAYNDTSILLLNIGLITNYLDYFMRFVALIIHAVYLFFLIYFKEFQVRSMLYLHHVNIVSMLYCLMFIMWIGSSTSANGTSKVTATTVLFYFLNRTDLI